MQVIAYDILNAMNTLHKKSIIHRDLKPRNILVNLNNDSKIIHAKISDFGLS